MDDGARTVGLAVALALLAGGCSLFDAAGTDPDDPASGTDGSPGDDDSPDAGGACNFFDDFEDGITGDAWDDFTQPGASVSEEAGAVRVSFSGAGAFAGYYLHDTIDLSEGEVQVEIADVGGMYTILRLEREGAMVSLYVEAGQVIIATVEGSGPADIGVPTEYLPTDDIFWRIRGEAGLLYWETSDDQENWGVLYSVGTPFPLDHVSVSIAGGGLSGDPPALFESFAMSANGCAL